MTHKTEQWGDLTITVSTSGKSLAYHCQEKNIVINQKTLSIMKEKIKELNLPTLRLCLYANANDSGTHEMLIIQRKNIVPFIHRHLTRQESYQILEGKLKITLFDEDMKITKEIMMDTKEQFLFKMAEKMWHSTTPETEFVIFKETRPGPFDTNDTVIYTK